jgi:hypothetical protein
MTRIMQQVGATRRPLSFSACGSQTLLLDGAATPWAALPFEVHRTLPAVHRAERHALRQLRLVRHRRHRLGAVPECVTALIF